MKQKIKIMLGLFILIICILGWNTKVNAANYAKFKKPIGSIITITGSDYFDHIDNRIILCRKR